MDRRDGREEFWLFLLILAIIVAAGFGAYFYAIWTDLWY